MKQFELLEAADIGKQVLVVRAVLVDEGHGRCCRSGFCHMSCSIPRSDKRGVEHSGLKGDDADQALLRPPSQAQGTIPLVPVAEQPGYMAAMCS